MSEPPRPTPVLFVCAGNICRSPLAERMLRARLAELGVCNIEVASAGLIAQPGEAPVAKTLAAARRAGIDLGDHHARRLSADALLPGMRVLVMERTQRERVLDMAPDLDLEVRLLGELAPGTAEIADPEDGDTACFDACVTRIRECVDVLAIRLIG